MCDPRMEKSRVLGLSGLTLLYDGGWDKNGKPQKSFEHHRWLTPPLSYELLYSMSIENFSFN